MIRTVVKPEDQNLSIRLPESFIGKQVEVIAFTIDEANTDAADKTVTHMASQAILAKDWLSPEEDLAWQNL